MTKGEWEIRLRCNGEDLLEGDIEQLHEFGEGMVRCWQFDVEGLLELQITREKTEKVKPA